MNESFNSQGVAHVKQKEGVNDYSLHFDAAFAELFSFGGGILKLGTGLYENSRPI